MDDVAYIKILLREQYFANLIQILIMTVSDVQEDSAPIISLKNISMEIDKILGEFKEGNKNDD